ncbi:hypothetical protein KVR01_009048 [Diaporthe batatas]|uniref:uncharacterized protein n=1 Tax=Diaporthe batatas TaxID=748121 RepID=UPI001D0364AA|nr:uncharacterized protein KVR01_009048 [Diaporthe batatas]KAG8160784.1 hypothetical protein KVR01_009048 [Diaporthe batatas]
MRFITAITAIGVIGIPAVNANCNPLKETCAPIPGITSPIHQDFTKFSSIEDVKKNGWTIADYASFRVDSKDGGVFPIERRTDAPYIWTTSYFLYGHVDVVMQAAPGIAIISSAVLMSDTADEIDWEWSGNNYRQSKPNVQTNYFGKGITANYDRSTSVFTEFEMTAGLHKYGIDWTAESLTWSIDGQVVRTLPRRDCDNADHQYPQTPSRFHLGVWVAGDPDRQAEGVRQWAGGNTDFSKLPYTAYVRSVDIEPSSKCAYYNYTDKSGSSKSVKCLAQLPQSVSSIVSSSVLNTLSAAQPAPPTTSQTSQTSQTRSLVASSSSSSSVTVAAGTTSTATAPSLNSQPSGGSSSSTGTTGGATSTDVASSQDSQATGSASSVQLTTSTVYKTTVFSTVTSCNTKVTDCPANKPLLSTVLVTDTVVDYTTVCPVTEGRAQSSTPNVSPASSVKTGSSATTQPAALSNAVAQNAASHSALASSGPSSSSKALSSSPTGATSTMKGTLPNKSLPWWYWLAKPVKRPVNQESPASSPPSESTQVESGEMAVTQSKHDVDSAGTSGTEPTNSPELMTTSTVYSTNIHTVTSCGLEVESCPAKSTVLSTEVVAAYTTVCPVSTAESSAPTESSEDGSREQSSQDGGTNMLPPSSSTMISSADAHDVAPSSRLDESQAASTSMEFGHSSVSLYNTDAEVATSGSSTARAAALPTDKGAPPIAQNHAVPGTESSEAGGSSDGMLTTRSTITRTTTVRLTTTRRSTSTLFSTSATVITSCAAGQSGADCSTISSTTTMIISKLVTPVTFTSTGVSTATETVDVALSPAAPHGPSGVAGAGTGNGTGTGTGQQPGGAKTALATIAGEGPAGGAVPGSLLGLAMGGVLFFILGM